MTQAPTTVDDTATCVGLKLNMDFQGSDIEVLLYIYPAFFLFSHTFVLLTARNSFEYSPRKQRLPCVWKDERTSKYVAHNSVAVYMRIAGTCALRTVRIIACSHSLLQVSVILVLVREWISNLNQCQCPFRSISSDQVTVVHCLHFRRVSFPLIALPASVKYAGLHAVLCCVRHSEQPCDVD